MFSPFSYIANRIRDAVIRGFGEGLEAVGAFEPDGTPNLNPLEALKARIAALAIPDKQPDADETTEPVEASGKKRKTA